MENACTIESYQLGNQTTSDVRVQLKNQHEEPVHFFCHSSILLRKSKFFADHLSVCQSDDKPIEVSFPSSDYDHYVKLLNLLYISEDAILDSLDSVQSALGVLRASLSLCCEAVTDRCIQYLEAMPWEEKEEEEILKIAPTLGPTAMSILARFQLTDLDATKNVFISAIRFATTTDKSFPPFTDELRTSAQEQVEYMLSEDEEMPLVAVDEEVKSEAKAGLAKMLTTFNVELNSLSSHFDQTADAAEQRVLQSISDLDWMCNILPKMGLMTDFVSGWAHISDHVLSVIQDDKYCSGFWAIKVRLVELVGRALEAIGFGSVVLPAASRVKFLKTWLPYLRMMKSLLDSKCAENEEFPHKMDSDLCQNIEGAIVSLVLALPSSDQADILTDWIKRTDQLRFPDLTEAFEVWCYRTKAAKRRLVVGFDGVDNNPNFQPLNEISN